jgi:hypothetical protein
MPKKQSISDLGYRLRARLLRQAKRGSEGRSAARKALEFQTRRLRQLTIYVEFLAGRSIEAITRDQASWTQGEVEEAIRTRGGTA